MQDPVQTVADYVFTDAIRGHFDRILRRVQDGQGQGFWVKGEYGGGKTHFLATLAALLEGDAQVWNAVADDDIRNFATFIQRQRLFPVVFSLRGESAAGGSGGRFLFEVLEEQIELAAEQRLGRRIDLNPSAELLAWYDGLRPEFRSGIDAWISDHRRATLQQIRLAAGADAAAEAVRDAAHALSIKPSVNASTAARLLRAYDLVVRQSGQYNGLLVIMDEFAFWQELHPEGTSAYAHDEDVLETLGWRLRRDEGLPIYTVVASQKDPPAKLRGQELGRFELLDVLSAESPEAKVRDYQRIVSHRVREIRPERLIEAREYAQHYRDLFGRRFDDEDAFLDAFPIEQHAYQILQLLTQSLASERVGINVVWEVLGQPGHGGEPEPSATLRELRRLVIAADLLKSPTLRQELDGQLFAAAMRARDNLLASLDRLDLGEERPLAETIAQTLFLWHVANRHAPRPLTLQQLAEATLLEDEVYGSPKDTALAIAGELAQLRQVTLDTEREEVSFTVDVSEGPDPATIFADLQRRPLEAAQLDRIWRETLYSNELRVDGDAALFDGLAPDTPAKAGAEYGKVEYPGEYVLAREWKPDLGRLPIDRSRHWRVVYLLERPAQGAELITSQLSDQRIAVVLPGGRTPEQEDALRTFAHYQTLGREMALRSDTEALRVRAWLAEPAQRTKLVWPLLRAQREVYRGGEVVTREAIGVDPRALFDGPASEPKRTITIAGRLLEHAYHGRPFGTPTAPQPIKGQVPSQLFAGLFTDHPTNAQREAARNYAPALGLAKHANPSRIDAGDCTVFAILRELLEQAEARNQPVFATAIYDQLFARGVPDELTTLYLLAFVYSPAENAELHLRQKSRVKLVSGAAPAEGRLTTANVRQLDFATISPAEFEQLAPRQGVTWDTALPIAQQFDATLAASSDPQQIDERQQRLVEAAKTLVRESSGALEELRAAANLMQQPLPAAPAAAAAEIARFDGATGYQQIYDRAQEVFDGDRTRLAEAVRTCRELVALRDAITPLRTAYSYLEATPLDRLEPELRTSAAMLRPRFRLDQLAAQPSLCGALLAEFEEWRRRYELAYTKFLREYFAAADRVRAERDAMEERLRALDNLERMLKPADPQAGGLRRAWQEVFAGLPEDAFDVRRVDVRQTPVCACYRVPFGARSPEDAAAEVTAELDRALAARLATVRGETVRRLLDDAATPPARRVKDALGVQDDEHWIRLLGDDARAGDVAALLHSIVAQELPILSRLRERFPTITRENLDRAVAAFREELESAIARAEGERGAGVTVEVTLR